MSTETTESVALASVGEPRLVRCPWCGSSRVWSYAAREWRCEECTREWAGTSALAASTGTRCDVCDNVVTSEDANGCRNCASKGENDK